MEGADSAPASSPEGFLASVKYYFFSPEGVAESIRWGGTALLFMKKHLTKAQEFYERYGGKTIIIARFIPIMRTFAPTVAGAAQMNNRRFAV